MLPAKIIQELESSDAFKEWRADNKDDYLTHVISMGDERGVMEIAVGYYDPESDKITTFVMGEQIMIKPKAEVFKKEGKVQALDITKAKLSFEKVMKEADKTVEENYKGAEVGRIIAILQNLDGSEVWNITVVTTRFGVINVRVDPENGNVVEHQRVNLFDQ